jgi:hypothetical protein
MELSLLSSKSRTNGTQVPPHLAVSQVSGVFISFLYSTANIRSWHWHMAGICFGNISAAKDKKDICCER